MGDADIEDEVGVCLGEGEVRGYHAVASVYFSETS